VRTNRRAIRQRHQNACVLVGTQELRSCERLWRLRFLWIRLYLQSAFTRLRLVGCQTQSDNVVESGSPITRTEGSG